MEQFVAMLALGGVLALIGWAVMKQFDAGEFKRSSDAWRAEQAVRAEHRAAHERAIRAMRTVTTCNTDVLGCAPVSIPDVIAKGE